jgi:hypothetical protein
LILYFHYILSREPLQPLSAASRLSFLLSSRYCRLLSLVAAAEEFQLAIEIEISHISRLSYRHLLSRHYIFAIFSLHFHYDTPFRHAFAEFDAFTVFAEEGREHWLPRNRGLSTPG